MRNQSDITYVVAIMRNPEKTSLFVCLNNRGQTTSVFHAPMLFKLGAWAKGRKSGCDERVLFLFFHIRNTIWNYCI